ncbi:tigger transposable element-derived protein 6-like [Penaeus monodon]|uniref:tigger transposable element-derived protein 6-like n=1 Tax=Penaeus monodon TaxID=6687 RepID=UPI0018A752B5|nr:tigger transposable element-derived protein 6-like [Penaeus monodon]
MWHRNLMCPPVCHQWESSSSGPGVVDNWQTTTLPENLKQIYNCDESALFYKLLPNKSLVLKGDTCHGGKRPKGRLTFMACANIDGSDKMELLVVGRVWTPRCFKNVKNIPLDYHANNKAWMTSNLFTQWSKKLDRREDKKVALVLDNCPAHLGQVPGLTNITLFFLPPNTTSKTQPLDLGIIQNLNMHFRKELLLREIKDDPKDDIPLSQLAMYEDGIPLASLFQQASQYMEVESTLDDYLSADQDLIAVTKETEDDIFKDVMSKHIGPRGHPGRRGRGHHPQPQPPSCETILSHLKDIQLFLETHPDMSDEFQHIQRIARRTRVKSMNNKKQKTTADFSSQK